jgi:hypothetical protein
MKIVAGQILITPLRRGLYGLYSSNDHTKPPLPITTDEAAYIEAAANERDIARRILEVSNRPLYLPKGDQA